MVTDGLTPLTFLLFAGLVFGSVVVLGGALVALAMKQPLWVQRLLGLEAVGLAAYAVIYLVASLISHNRTLDLGQEKHICEIDCHLAYEVIVGGPRSPRPVLDRHGARAVRLGDHLGAPPPERVAHAERPHRGRRRRPGPPLHRIGR